MDKIKKYKKIYLGLKVPDSRVNERWKELKAEIAPTVRLPFPYRRYGVIFFAFVLLFFGSLLGFARTSSPGSSIYPVKVLSDKIISKLSGKPEYKVERRAEDLIEASKTQTENVKEAEKEYQKALEETEKEVQAQEASKPQVEDSLNKQEELFKDAIKENPKAEEQLNKAIENANKFKEKLKDNPSKEVKGF